MNVNDLLLILPITSMLYCTVCSQEMYMYALTINQLAVLAVTM